MIYLYNCPNCGCHDVLKSYKEVLQLEYCPDCSLLMTRVFTTPQIITKDLYTGYNPSLGKDIKNRKHLNEELKRHEDTTGIKLQEIGNETANVKKKKLSLDLTDKECNKAAEILQSVGE